MRTYTSIGVEKYITMGFLSLILTGTLLLWTLNNQFSGPALSWIDSLFLATSAVCVTGLTPVDIGTGLTLPSQTVLLCLIQLGGIGIMSATAALLLAAGQRLPFRSRLFLAGGLGVDTPRGVIRLLKFLLFYTACFEGIGALLLFFEFKALGSSSAHAVYQAIFHSISAFCNAGFSPYATNLRAFDQSYLLPTVIMSLIVIGGIGFPVMLELSDYHRGKIRFLSPYTKTVLVTTFALIVAGTCALATAEWNGSFSGLSTPHKIWNSLFASVTARTAGFETTNYALWSTQGVMITIVLMFIGASPSSTGGGLKTTTLAILVWSAWSELRQREDVVIWNRTISPHLERRALCLAFIYLLTAYAASIVIATFEDIPYISTLFEVVSALGTVGLSRNVTPGLSSYSKIVLVMLMFWGRVGILTFSYSLIPHYREVAVKYPETNIPIG